MSVDSAFKTELVKDATIADITPDLTYAVVSGASSTTYQQFTASSNSNSSLNWSVQLPSESIVMGRDVLLNTTMTLTINCGSVAVAGNQVPVGAPAFTYGVNNSTYTTAGAVVTPVYPTAFSPFPFSQLIGTASAQINNTTVAVNLPDVLPQFLALNDRSFLTEFNATTPSLPDSDYGTYSDAAGAGNNPLSSYNNAEFVNGVQPRGTYPVVIGVAHQIYGGAIDDSLISTDVRDTWVITLAITVTEPIFISPFSWSDPTRSAMGMVGINNFTLTLNMTPPGALVGGVPQTRCFGSASPYITSITPGVGANGTMFGSPKLLLKFLSTQPSDRIETRNVVPYTDFPRYITPSSNAGTIASGASLQITTQNIQINQMPSKFIIAVRLPQSLQTIKNPSTFLTITNISINLNNASGLLSSTTPQNLWKISRRNGSNQTWQQFSGFAQQVGTYGIGGQKGVKSIPTGGSVLVLDPALDLSLPETLSNGSLGQYNFQAQITVQNQYGYAITPEVVVVCVNDGIMVTNQGTSTCYTGILTRQMVMDAKEMAPIPTTEESRMVGGKMGDMSLVRHAYSRLPDLQKFISKHLEKLTPTQRSGMKHHLSSILK
jgi:hypothetical protein